MMSSQRIKKTDPDSTSKRVEKSRKEIERLKAECERLVHRGLAGSPSNSTSEGNSKSPRTDTGKSGLKSASEAISDGRTTVSESVFNENSDVNYDFKSDNSIFKSKSSDVSSGHRDINSKNRGFSLGQSDGKSKHSDVSLAQSINSDYSLGRSDIKAGNSDFKSRQSDFNNDNVNFKEISGGSGNASDNYSTDFYSKSGSTRLSEAAQAKKCSSLSRFSNSKNSGNFTSKPNLSSKFDPVLNVQSKSQAEKSVDDFKDDQFIDSKFEQNTDLKFEQKKYDEQIILSSGSVQQSSAFQSNPADFLETGRSGNLTARDYKKVKPKVSSRWGFVKTPEENVVCPSKHKKSYNIEEAREFMRKQKEKRLEETRMKLKQSENTIEERKKKLKELNELSLKIIAKNRERSRSRSKDPQSVRDSPLRTIDINKRQTSIINRKRPSRERVKSQEELQLTYRLEKSKTRAAIVIQAYFRGYRQRQIYKELLEGNKKRRVDDSQKVTGGHLESQENLQQTKEYHLQNEGNIVKGLYRENIVSNELSENIVSNEQKVNIVSNKQRGNLVSNEQIVNIVSNKQGENIISNEQKVNIASNEQKVNIASNEQEEFITVVNENTVLDGFVQNLTKKDFFMAGTQAENKNIPEWLKATQSNPYSFMSAVKQKLIAVQNLSAKTSEVSVQSSPQLSTKELKEKIMENIKRSPNEFVERNTAHNLTKRELKEKIRQSITCRDGSFEIEGLDFEEFINTYVRPKNSHEMNLDLQTVEGMKLSTRHSKKTVRTPRRESVIISSNCSIKSPNFSTKGIETAVSSDEYKSSNSSMKVSLKGIRNELNTAISSDEYKSSNSSRKISSKGIESKLKTAVSLDESHPLVRISSKGIQSELKTAISSDELHSSVSISSKGIRSELKTAVSSDEYKLLSNSSVKISSKGIEGELKTTVSSHGSNKNLDELYKNPRLFLDEPKHSSGGNQQKCLNDDKFISYERKKHILTSGNNSKKSSLSEGIESELKTVISSDEHEPLSSRDQLGISSEHSSLGVPEPSSSRNELNELNTNSEHSSGARQQISLNEDKSAFFKRKNMLTPWNDSKKSSLSEGIESELNIAIPSDDHDPSSSRIRLYELNKNSGISSGGKQQRSYLNDDKSTFSKRKKEVLTPWNDSNKSTLSEEIESEVKTAISSAISSDKSSSSKNREIKTAVFSDTHKSLSSKNRELRTAISSDERKSSSSKNRLNELGTNSLKQSSGANQRSFLDDKSSSSERKTSILDVSRSPLAPWNNLKQSSSKENEPKESSWMEGESKKSFSKENKSKILNENEYGCSSDKNQLASLDELKLSSKNSSNELKKSLNEIEYGSSLSDRNLITSLDDLKISTKTSSNDSKKNSSKENEYSSSLSDRNLITSLDDLKLSTRISSKVSKIKYSLRENELSFNTMQSASSESGSKGKSKKSTDCTTIDERLSSEIAPPPPLIAPDITLHSNHDSDKENRVEDYTVKAGGNKRPEATNQMNVKFEEEIHLLNDFNESLRQFMAIEKSLLDLRNDKSNVQRETRDTQTSFLTKSIAEDNSRRNDKSISKSSPIVTTLNYSRGSDFLPEKSSMVVDSVISINQSSINDTSVLGNSLLLEKTALEVSEMNEKSAVNDESLEISKVFANNRDGNRSFAGLSLGMFEQMIKDEDARIENLKTILKIREKALLDRTKGELTWLEIQKKQLLETGKLHEASLVKKKQRGILIKLQHEKHEMRKLKEMQKAASKERKTILKQQQNTIKAQLSTNGTTTKIKRTTSKERRASGPLRVYNYHRETTVKSEVSISKSSVARELIYTSKSESAIGERKLDSDEAQTESLLVNTHTEIAKRSLVMREAALQKRRKAAEELLQWHQKLLDEERKITELEMAASNIINQVPSLTVDNSSSAQNTYKFLGSQLNVLWENMTGLSEKQFKDAETYNLSQIALERFCKDAKKHSSKKIAGECNTSQSSMSEIMHNISSITDEISELYKLSSVKNEGENEVSKSAVRVLGTRMSRSESVKNNRQLSVNKDSLNASSRQNDSQRDLSRKQSLNTNSEAGRQILSSRSASYQNQQTKKGTSVSSELELEKNVTDESRQEIEELEKSATVKSHGSYQITEELEKSATVESQESYQITEELEKSGTDKSQESEKISKELEKNSIDKNDEDRHTIEELEKSATDDRQESRQKTVQLEKSATVKSHGRQKQGQCKESASEKSQESRRKTEEHEHTSESISSLDDELSVISKDCIPSIKSDSKSSSVADKHNLENVSISSSIGGKNKLEHFSKSSSAISLGGKHNLESVSKSNSVVSVGGKHNLESVSKSSSVIHLDKDDKTSASEEIVSQASPDRKTLSDEIVSQLSDNKQKLPSEELVSVESNLSVAKLKQASGGMLLHDLVAREDGSILQISKASLGEEMHSNYPEETEVTEDVLVFETIESRTNEDLQESSEKLVESWLKSNEASLTSNEQLSGSLLKTNEDFVASGENDEIVSGNYEMVIENLVESNNEDGTDEDLVISKPSEDSSLLKIRASLKTNEDSSPDEIPTKSSLNDVEQIISNSSLLVGTNEEFESSLKRIEESNDKAALNLELQTKDHSNDEIPSNSALELKEDHSSHEILSNLILETKEDHSSHNILSNSVLETEKDNSNDRILSNSVLETKDHSSDEIPSNSVLETKDHSNDQILSNSLLKMKDHSSAEIPSNSALKINEHHSNDEILSHSVLKTKDHTSDEVASNSVLKIKDHSNDGIPSNSSLMMKEIAENNEIISKPSVRASHDGKVSSEVSLELKPLGRNRNLGKDAKNSHNTSVKRSFVAPKANEDQIESDDSSRITDHLGEIEDDDDVQSILKTNDDKEISLGLESREENEDTFEESKEGLELDLRIMEEASNDRILSNSVLETKDHSSDEIPSNSVLETKDHSNDQILSNSLLKMKDHSSAEKSQEENKGNLISDEFENSYKDETNLISGKVKNNFSPIPDEIKDDTNIQSVESLDDHQKKNIRKQLNIDEQRELSGNAIHDDSFNSMEKTKNFEKLVQNKLSSLDDVEFLDFNASMKEIGTPSAISVDKYVKVEECVDNVDKKIKVEEKVDYADRNVNKVQESVDRNVKVPENVDRNVKVEESVDRNVKVQESVDRNVQVEESVDVSSRDANSSISSEIEISEEAISSDDLSRVAIIEVTIEGRKDVLSSSSEKDEDSEEEGDVSEKSKPHVSVKQRVSEIMADAYINTSIGDKSPRLQDLYVTTYDVITPEGSPELGSPVESKSVSPKDIYGNEAEELLRKQLAIEQEIKQLEQQQQLPYLFMREIPNKPPPPYTPPVQTAPVLPPTVLPMTVEQISSMTLKISEILFEAHRRNTLTDTALPEDLPSENIDRDCWEFVFDLCKEYASGHYKQFEEVSTVSWMKSANLRLGFKKDLEQSTLKDYLDQRLRRVFEFEKEETKESMIIKWSRKKRDHVDELLVVESQAEEVVWTNYNQDESIVRNEVTNDILKMLLDETAEVFKKIVAKRN